MPDLNLGGLVLGKSAKGEASGGEDDTALADAGQELADAIKSGDGKAIAQAFRTLRTLAEED